MASLRYLLLLSDEESLSTWAFKKAVSFSVWKTDSSPASLIKSSSLLKTLASSHLTLSTLSLLNWEQSYWLRSLLASLTASLCDSRSLRLACLNACFSLWPWCYLDIWPPRPRADLNFRSQSVHLNDESALVFLTLEAVGWMVAIGESLEVMSSFVILSGFRNWLIWWSAFGEWSASASWGSKVLSISGPTSMSPESSKQLWPVRLSTGTSVWYKEFSTCGSSCGRSEMWNSVYIIIS